jgi:hypothetical protein
MRMINFRKPERWTTSEVLNSLCSIICCPYLLCVLAYVWTEDGVTNTSSYISEEWRKTNMYKKKEAKKYIIAERKKFEEVLRYKAEDGKWCLKEYPSKGVERLQRAMETRSKPKHAWGHMDSGFCKLPAEIRLRIYEMVVGQEALPPHEYRTVAARRRCIHIHRHFDRKTLFGHPCVHDGPISNKWNAKLCQCRSERGHWIDWNSVWHHDYTRLGIGMIPLALSCRFISEEVLDWIYTWPTFVFHRPETMLLFLFSLPPRYRDRVRSVYLDGRGAGRIPALNLSFEHMPRIIRRRRGLRKHESVWPAACTLLSDARGLRHVKASICNVNFLRVPPTQLVEFALEPLIGLKKAKGESLNIEVEVDWDEGGENSDMDREIWKNGDVVKRVDRSVEPDLEGTEPITQEMYDHVYGQEGFW